MTDSRSTRTALAAIAMLIACGSARPTAAELAVDSCAGACGRPSASEQADPARLDGDNVAVTEPAAGGVGFVDSRVGDASRFDAPAGATLGTVSNGFSQGAAKDAGNPAGTFGYAVTCPACGEDGNPQTGPVSLTVFGAAGITIGQFNSSGASYYVSSEVMGPGSKMGNMLANASGMVCPAACGDLKVSEPNSIGIFGAALIGLAAVRRRYKSIVP